MTKKIRTLKALLQILLDNVYQISLIDEHGDAGIYGLCELVGDLENSGIISFEEEHILNDFIQTNRPKSAWLSNRANNLAYYWEQGNRPLRRAWIRRKLKKL